MIRVCGDRVLVALPPRVDEQVSPGGIVLVKDPDRSVTPTRGIVVALGQHSGAVDIDEVLAVLDEIQTETSAAEVRTAMKALGPAPFEVQVGDCVIFPTAAGDDVRDGEIDYVIVRESDIIGILEPVQKVSAA